MADSVGSIQVLYGSAEAKSDQGVRTLSQGDPVFQGETVTTGPESAVEIRFEDGTVLSQSEESIVTLDTYVFDPDTGAGDVLLKLTQGAFRTATGAIVDTNPEKFKVQSPLATIGIRGTHTGHLVPGGGLPENHGCLVFDGKPVVVQSNLGGPPMALFGPGLQILAGIGGLGGIRPFSPQQQNFFNTLSEGGLRQGPPNYGFQKGWPDVGDEDDNGGDHDQDDDDQDEFSGEGGNEPDDPTGGNHPPTPGIPGLLQMQPLLLPGLMPPLGPPAPPPPAAPKGNPGGKIAPVEVGGDNTDIYTLVEGDKKDTPPPNDPPKPDDPPQEDPPQDDPPKDKPKDDPQKDAPHDLHHGCWWSGDTVHAEGLPFGNDDGQGVGIYLNNASNYIIYFDKDPMSDDLDSGIRHAQGSAFDDTLTGDDNVNTLKGGDGTDTLFGHGGNDQLYGEKGSDTIYGGKSGGTATGDDTLFGGDGQDRLYGQDGKDVLYGGADGDFLYGGDEFGNDVGTGDDTLYGEGGADELHGHDGNDTLFGGTENDQMYGGADDDSLYGGEGNDNLFGGADPTVSPGTGNDHLFGEGGEDKLYGFDGQDYLDGGADRDELYGGDGDDTLMAGPGGDVLTGDNGADKFTFASKSTDYTGLQITDFAQGEDKLNFCTSGPDGFDPTAKIKVDLPATGAAFYLNEIHQLYYDDDWTDGSDSVFIAEFNPEFQPQPGTDDITWYTS